MAEIHKDAERLREMVADQDALIGRLLAEIKCGREDYKAFRDVVMELMAAYGPSEDPKVIYGLVKLANVATAHFARVMASGIEVREVTPEQLAELMDKGDVHG